LQASRRIANAKVNNASAVCSLSNFSLAVSPKCRLLNGICLIERRTAKIDIGISENFSKKILKKGLFLENFFRDFLRILNNKK
jgi:hypothetical protein